MTPEQGMNCLIGQVLKKLKTEGKLASPVLVRRALEEIIDESIEQQTQKSEDRS